jgi:hypothetical protein
VCIFVFVFFLSFKWKRNVEGPIKVPSESLLDFNEVI